MYEEGDLVELRNVSFRVKMVNNSNCGMPESSQSYELESEYGTLDFVPPVNVTKREPRVGDVYKVEGAFRNDNVYLHLIGRKNGDIQYFRTDDPGNVTHTSWIDLSETELVLEGP